MKPGRNDPCSCGSGKKYKHCCEGKIASRITAPLPAEINPLVILYNAGRYVELESRARLLVDQYPGFGFGWKLLGGALQMQGKYALPVFQKTAELMPDDADAHYNLGVALKSLGLLEDAVVSYRRALKIKPDYAEAHGNLGNVLKDLGRLDDAVDSYRQALQCNPNLAEIHNSLGAALKDLGKLGDAEASYRRALKIKPDYAEAHNNLGNVLNDSGRLGDAEASYRRAVEIKENCVEALNNLANLLVNRGELLDALKFIMRSLRIEDSRENKRLFVNCVKRFNFTHADGYVRDALVRAVSEPWCRPVELAWACMNILKFNPNFAECMARAAAAWPQRLAARELYGAGGVAAVADDKLLCCYLESTQISYLELERFLTMARFTLLVAASGGDAVESTEKSALDFYGALVRQCFINEYVFACTEDEAELARNLRDSLISALESNAAIPVLWPLAVASYFPLKNLPFAARLLDSSWPEAVDAVLTQQVREPETERQLRTTIPCLTGIDDEVSLLVQNQYEENPYPRWIRAAPVASVGTIDEALRRVFLPMSTFNPLGKNSAPDILIAGCGTGQQPIEAMQRFPGARLLAVDLSLTSLSYAKRKSQELGLTMIEYAQADIMKLGALDRSFDAIESSGVLHHLADPLAGWRVLLSLLRPGGVMRLGFYSEAARRGVVLARTYIAEQSYGSTAEDIRQCRQELVSLDKSSSFGSVLKSSDFFSTSACRDLLFHVQEHRMTLAGIEAFLRENDLQFLGFENLSNALQAYRLRFPDDQAGINLGNWQIFENENPDTFIGMYQFWIQKPG